MLHTALRRGAASSRAASMRSLPVGSTPSLSARRRRSSSALQGASSFWLSSTSNRSRSFSMTSSKVARVTRILGFKLPPATHMFAGREDGIYEDFCANEKGGRAALFHQVRISAAVQHLGQPQADRGEQIQQHHGNHLDAHERHHARENLVERN